MHKPSNSQQLRVVVAVSLCLGACSSSPHEGTPQTPSPAGSGAAVASSTTDAPRYRVDAGASTAADAGAMPALKDVRCQADKETPQRTDYAKPGTFGVGSIEMTFVDTSRPIKATDKHPAAASRSLVTTIYYPTAQQAPLFGQTPLAAGGPFAMLMYSHGYSSSRDEGAPVAKQAASYGYIVVVPEFPLTNIGANGGSPDVTDAANQPGDVSYLIDQMLALSADRSSLFANAVDESRIGALGVSLGGLTTWLVSFHPKLHDPRIKAAVPIAGLSSFFGAGFYRTRELPTLILHGDIDAFINYDFNARRSFTRAAPNARLITLTKGTHAAFGTQLDATTTAALNALLAPAGADPSNPDGLGCGAVGATLQETGPEFLASFGGPDDFIEPDPNPAATKPCQGTEYTKPAMDAFEQEGIAVSSAVAFFDAYFSKSPETRQDGCRYLLHEVPKNPAVKLE